MEHLLELRPVALGPLVARRVEGIAAHGGRRFLCQAAHEVVVEPALDQKPRGLRALLALLREHQVVRSRHCEVEIRHIIEDDARRLPSELKGYRLQIGVRRAVHDAAPGVRAAGERDLVDPAMAYERFPSGRATQNEVYNSRGKV